MYNYKFLFVAFLTSLGLVLLAGKHERQYAYAVREKISHFQDSATALSCHDNPFKAPGWLNHSEHNLEDNRWVPFEDGCTTPDLLSAVINRDPTLNWMRGRTVVLFGNSVDRQHLELFCSFTNGVKVVAFPGTPLAPPLVEPLLEGVTVASAAQPQYCLIQEYDFYLVFAFHYGLDTREFWRALLEPSGYLTPPTLAEERIDTVLLPFLSNLKRYKIDLGEVASFEWDANLANKQYGGPDPVATHLQITRDFMPFYLRRLPQLARKVVEAFPDRTNNFPVLWRFPHMTARDECWPLIGAAMQQATLAIFEAPEWQGKIEIDPVGDMLLGGKAFLQDGVHPKERPLPVIWSNYILWQLRNAVGGK